MILIVGAGPTGMTAAIELRRAGFDVRIIDKSDRMAQHSQALVVQARTLEQLQRYGLAKDAVARGRKLSEARFYSDGKQIVSFKLDQVHSRYPYVLFLPQSETEAILNQHMEGLGVKTERQVELMRLTQEDGVIRATLRHKDGAEEEVSPRWVLGCDGAHSAVRHQIGMPFEGTGYGISFFLGDLEIDGPDAPQEELCIHVRHGDVVFMGRLSDRTVRLIVALHAKQDLDQDRRLSIEDFQQAVDQVGVRVKIKEAQWMTPFRVTDRQAQHYRVGNIFLAGDASHIHSPVGGQGMNTGMQDVANLGWKLAVVERGADPRLLDSYEEERGEVGKSLLRFTGRGLKMATTTNPVLELLRNSLAPVLSKLEPIQKAAIGFISETSIEYRASSIVADVGGDGDLRAGDRLPDLALGHATTETTLLKDRTSAKHLALVLNGTVAEVNDVRATLPGAEVTALETSQLDKQGQRLLGGEKKVILIRPDGYVGYRGPLESTSRLVAYARQDGLA